MTPSDLIQMRKARNWTQARLAEEVGTTQASICRYEKGSKISGPALRQLQRLKEETVLLEEQSAARAAE